MKNHNIMTGFVELDRMIGGFRPGEVIMLGGRPSMGKTTLALQFAENALFKNVPVVVFSLEQSKEQLSLRMLCTEIRVDFQKSKTGNIAETEWEKSAMRTGKLTLTKIFIDDTPRLSILEMGSKSRQIKAEYGLGMIIVDYLQLMGGYNGTDQENYKISRSLKAMAKELNVPVIILSQLSRQVEDRIDKRPQISDFHESGVIEQDADVILFIYRDEFYHPDLEESKGRAEIIIRNNRNGPTGTVHLTFVKEDTRFENCSSSEL